MERTACLRVLQPRCRGEFCGNERVAEFRGFEFVEENPLLPTQRHGKSRRNSSTRSPRWSWNINIDGIAYFRITLFNIASIFCTVNNFNS